MKKKKMILNEKSGEILVEEKKPESEAIFNLQKIIATRAENIFPIFIETFPDEFESGLAYFPKRMIALPEKIEGDGLSMNYPYRITFFEKDFIKAQKNLDVMISFGKQEIEFGNKILWLYAIDDIMVSRVPGKPFYKVDFTYIFRAKMAPEQILEEVKQND